MSLLSLSVNFPDFPEEFLLRTPPSGKVMENFLKLGYILSNYDETMIEAKVVARKWGNSVGFVLPKEIATQAKIGPGMEVSLLIQEKKLDFKKLFGSLKIDEPTQEILDEIRKGDL